MTKKADHAAREPACEIRFGQVGLAQVRIRTTDADVIHADLAARLAAAPQQEHLLLTRYNPRRVTAGEMMSVDDVKEILGIDVIGVIPESPDVLSASNAGTPVILSEQSDVSHAYVDAVARLLGDTVTLRFIDEPRKGFLARMFGG